MNNFHFSSDTATATSLASTASNTSLAFIDADTFSISIETLIKAAATNNPSVAKLGRPSTKSVRSHKKTRPLTSRIHKPKHKSNSPVIHNESLVKDKNYIEPKTFKLKPPQKMSTPVPQLTKLPQTWWLSYYPPRFLTLFLLGSFTSFIVDHLLTQNHITEYPKDTAKLIDTAAWIPPTCGLSAILIGSLFPLVDYWLRKKPQEFQREWSNVIR
ncbi:524_t:CDS:1 [Acaulospora colombiana]|uniref:524_t:CDS:1 n=1 Tax=Acaulospora colombiana TaxID=27376 RepID=A0ACA9LC89_9GLOM|nr:524_t:CDS:1 [Acaulospora colombiana]